jgi:hypothetical protein
VEFASTEKSAADAEHAPNTTQATCSSQTQPATTSQKSYVNNSAITSISFFFLSLNY